MRLLPIFIALCLLVGCSEARKAQYHYKKALKHGLVIVNDSDTIQIISIDSFAVIKNDTIVWEKIIRSKDTVIFFKNVYVPKTKWQTRIEYRYKTQLVKQDVLKYKYIYKDSKNKKAKTNWQLFFWGLGTGLLLSLLWRLFIKKMLSL